MNVAFVHTKAGRAVLFLAACLLIMVAGMHAYPHYLTKQKIDSCNKKTDCYQLIILAAIKEKGFESGFSLLGRIYAEDPDFRPRCHSFMLGFVDVLYDEYPDATEIAFFPNIATCNYGFLQQYPQSIIVKTKNIDEAIHFCDRVREEIGNVIRGAEHECWRGIGRGLPIYVIAHAGTSEPEEIAPVAVSKCEEEASSLSIRNTCISAVFNILGRLAVKGRFGVSADTDNPMSLCDKQKDERVRGACFNNYKIVVVAQADLKNINASVEKIEELYSHTNTPPDASFWSLGYEWARTRLLGGGNMEDVLGDCLSLPEEGRTSCIAGVSVGLAKHAAAWKQHEPIAQFCRKARDASPNFSNDCPSPQALGYLKGFYPLPEFTEAHRFMEQVVGDLPKQDRFAGYGY